MNKKILLSLCMIFLLVFMTCCVSGNQRMYADNNDIIAYYGLDTPAGTSGYTYAISTEEYFICPMNRQTFLENMTLIFAD